MFGALTENPVRALGADTFLPSYSWGLVRASPSLPRKGALTKINSSGIIFWALAGLSGKSPGAITEENCFRIILVIISPGGGGTSKWP